MKMSLDNSLDNVIREQVLYSAKINNTKQKYFLIKIIFN